MAKADDPPDSQETEPYRVLLVVDELFRGDEMAEGLKGQMGDHDSVQILLVAPALAGNRVDQELGNIDVTFPEAEERMTAALKELSEAGLDAQGEVGDADPLVAIDDALARFPADRIVVVNHVDGDALPAEEGMWDRLSLDYRQPVTQLKVTIPVDGEPQKIADIERAPARERTEEEKIRATRNFPPLSRRDLTGILFGLLGTAAIGLVAVGIGTEYEGALSGKAAAAVLIAIGAFLINVAHVIALLFFESVRYDGFWDRFMARMSIGVTSLGLIAALILWLT